MSTDELRQHLNELQSERALATVIGLDGNETYMSDLEAAYEACRAAYVGAAVTEIATFRAQLTGPQQG
jgi:hypothetical protein